MTKSFYRSMTSGLPAVLLLVLTTSFLVYWDALAAYYHQSIPDTSVEGPRILCAIHTHPGNHKKYAVHIKNTWGKRCTVLLFITTNSSDSSDLPILVVNIREGYNNMWTKSAASYPIIYERYFDKVDWFFKCDDDAYVIMENLHDLVRRHSTEEPIYFSYRINMHMPQGYPQGGAGYILSREALRRLVTRGLGNSSLCKKAGYWEDAEAGRCLWALNVTLMDARDELNRHKFLPIRPHVIVPPEELSANLTGKEAETLKWYKNHGKYAPKHGPDCCSDKAISFHYVSPQDMYVFEYFLYGLKRRG